MEATGCRTLANLKKELHLLSQPSQGSGSQKYQRTTTKIKIVAHI